MGTWRFGFFFDRLLISASAGAYISGVMAESGGAQTPGALPSLLTQRQRSIPVSENQDEVAGQYESEWWLDHHPRPVRKGKKAEALAAADRAAVECKTTIAKTGSNGDENNPNIPNRIGNYHKGLEHDEFGEVIPQSYRSLLRALEDGDDNPELFERIILGFGAASRKLVNPQAGLAEDVEGPDPQNLKMRAAPSVISPETAAEAVEVYWMALLRDVAFTQFSQNADVATAAGELSDLKEFTGPKVGGKVTAETVFRGCETGNEVGPLLSQFLLHDVPYGSLTISQRQQTVKGEQQLGPGKADYLTKFPEWLAVQNGSTSFPADQLDPIPRYIRNMRDLGRYVQVDALYEAYLNACLILLGNNAPVDEGNPYTRYRKQMGFGTFGGPHILSLVTEVATRALKAVWYQKWFVHRRLRPEAYGGLAHVKLVGVDGTKKPYPLDSQFVNSEALKRTRSKFGGAALLPMAFPEGSPTHPSYGAGHATVAGACVTVLKAWFDDQAPLPLPPKEPNFNPDKPDEDGTKLEDYKGPGAGSLTIGGELNKVAANIAIGRNMAGVHWRSDYYESLRLGEQVALCILRRQRNDYNEDGWFFTLTTFDNQRIRVSRKGIRLEGGGSYDLECPD
jgi:hypothetical protein